MNKAQHIALSVALFFNFSLSAIAKEAPVDSHAQWYQVDLVVFRYLNNDSGEVWPTVTDNRVLDESIRLQPFSPETGDDTTLFEIPEADKLLSRHHDIVRDAYIALPNSEMILSKQVAALGKNRNYQVITQKAWRMPVSSESDNHPVEVRAAISGQDNLLLDGTISISEERFLHVDIDLWLNKLTAESLYSTLSGKAYSNELNTSEILTSDRGTDNLIRPDNGSAPLRITDNFQIKQRRRVKNTNEIQYIDSPEIGVLFKLTPYERPETLVETGIKISKVSSQ